VNPADEVNRKAASSPTLRVVIAGGGTGGHLYPGLAIAACLQRRHRGAEIRFIGTRRLEASKVPQAGYAFRAISVEGIAGPLRFSGLWRRLKGLAQLASGLPLWQSLWLLGRFKPDVVVGTGGYVCGPVVLAARLLRIPSLSVEQNQFPGITTRALARWVKVAVVVSEESAQLLRRLRPELRTEVVGTPVRPEVIETRREQGVAALGLDPGKRTLLAFGGSIGSLALNRALVGALKRLGQQEWFSREVQVLHLTGERNPVRLEPEGAAALGLHYQARPYLDEMHLALAAADLVVCRAGGTSLAEVAARGIPAIIVPWAGAANREQERNAQPLVEAGGAILIREEELTEERLAAEVGALLRDPERLGEMSRRSRRVGRPEAAERVVALIEELAGL